MLHWISEHECVLQNVKVTMNFAGVGIDRVITPANARIEKSEKLARASVEHLWLAPCFQGEILGAMQTRVKAQCQLNEPNAWFHVTKNGGGAAGPLRARFDAAVLLCNIADSESSE